MTPLFELVLLGSRHDRTAFDCGSEPLNRYFSQQASQDVRCRVTACYVALSQDGRIAGFYTLASAALLLSQLPADLGKRLPRYPTVPAVRMGRLAVDQAFKPLRARVWAAPCSPMPWRAPCAQKLPPMPWWSMPSTQPPQRSTGTTA